MENLIVCAGKYLQDLVGVIGIVWLSETGQPQHPSLIMKRLRLTYWHNINHEVSLKRTLPQKKVYLLGKLYQT